MMVFVTSTMSCFMAVVSLYVTTPQQYLTGTYPHVLEYVTRTMLIYHFIQVIVDDLVF